MNEAECIAGLVACLLALGTGLQAGMALRELKDGEHLHAFGTFMAARSAEDGRPADRADDSPLNDVTVQRSKDRVVATLLAWVLLTFGAVATALATPLVAGLALVLAGVAAAGGWSLGRTA